MAELITILVNGRVVKVESGTVVAAALFAAGQPCRISVAGEARAPLCGMGICFECRAVIDGIAHRRACQTMCAEGMTVETMQ